MDIINGRERRDQAVEDFEGWVYEPMEMLIEGIEEAEDEDDEIEAMIGDALYLDIAIDNFIEECYDYQMEPLRAEPETTSTNSLEVSTLNWASEDILNRLL